MKSLIIKLKGAVKHDLPGEEAHRIMAPAGRKPTSHFLDVVSGARKAGVLILLYPVRSEPFVVFMKRPDYPGVHSGQISLPGGEFEKGDKDLVETALREANEELNVMADNVNVIGSLSDLYIPPSNFLVTPVLAYSDQQPEFIPEKKEVAAVIEMPLAHILDQEAVEREITVRQSYKITAPSFEFDDHIIWGATAMILSEFKSLLNE